MRVCSPLLATVALFLSVPTLACDMSCKRGAIDAYFARLDQVYRGGSTIADVDSLFELLADEVRYEHVEYQANFDKAAWHSAFASNLERGAYQADQTRAIAVLQAIDGKQHMAVQYAYGDSNEVGEWKQSEEPGLLILFGFSGDRISLVREYW